MANRAEAWQAALTDTDPAVREFAEVHIFGEFGFSNRARSVYLAAGMGDSGMRAVYALLTRADCPLLHAFDSRELYMQLLPYFRAEFRAAPFFSPGWQYLVVAMPRFMRSGFARMFRKRGGFAPRNGVSVPHSARFDKEDS
jgi:hypothetical protein